MSRVLSKITSSSITRVVLGCFFGSIFLFLSLQKISWAGVEATLSNADLRYVILASAVALINLFLKVVRWNFMLAPSGAQIRMKDLSASFLVAQLINSLVPLRLGEISRVYVIGRLGAAPGFVLGTILGEKYLDILAYTLLAGILLLGMPVPDWMTEKIPVIFVALVFTILILFLMLLNRTSFFNLVARLSERFSDRIGSSIMDHLHAGFASLAVFQKLSDFSRLALTTGLIWITAFLTNQILFSAIGVELPLQAGLLSLVAVMAGLSLPALPAKIGTFEYASILALGYYGLERSTGLSYGILLHVVVFLPVLLLGFLAFLYLQYRGLKPAAP